jgi:hypothetical protein
MKEDYFILFLRTMKVFRKITSLFLLPVMLLSFTGASLHVHFCGHTGRIYANIYYANLAHDSFNNECCHQHENERQCSADSCEKNDLQQDDSCCFDLQNEFTTDKNFSPSSHSPKISITAIDLTGNASTGKSDKASQTFICLPEFRTNRIPPPLQSMTVLIL